jgi:hypothetical protein
LTREQGLRRQTDTDGLFSALVDQRQENGGNEFVFRGDPDDLWAQVSLFVDEESACCPFFTFEINEQPYGVILRVAAPPPTGPAS